MSQVRKYAKGGGTITKGGVTYEYTPELAQELSQFLSINGAQDLYEIVDGFANGDHIKINPNGTIQGVSAWEEDKRLDANTSNWRKNLDAWNNNRYHKIRSQLPILSGWIPNSSKKSETPDNLIDIFGNKDWFEYSEDENGSKTYLNNSNKNNQLMLRLDSLTEYLSDEEAGKKKFRLGQEYDAAKMAGLKQLFSANKNRWGVTIDTLKNRIKSGAELTPEEIAFLGNFNIIKVDDATPDDSDGKLNDKDKHAWTEAGFGSLIDSLGGKAHLNDDGSLSLNAGESWGWNLGDLNGRNIWFNDDFYNSKYGVDDKFTPYKNLTLYNGSLYAIDNPKLKKILDAENSYNALMRQGKFNEADNIILTRFTDAAGENPASLPDDAYSKFLSDHPEYLYSNLTGLYNIDNHDLENGQQLIQYVDLNDENSFVGPYRRYTYKYKILDDRGNPMEAEVDPAKIAKIINGTSRDLLTYKRTNAANGAYAGRYYEDLLDANGAATGFRFYRKINAPNDDVILHMPKIDAVSAKDKDIKLPTEIAELLTQKMENNPNWFGSIVGTARNKEHFMRLMSALVQNWAKKIDFIPGSEERWLKQMWFTDNEINTFLRAWRKAKQGSRSQRRMDWLVAQMQKNGGVILAQTGGKSGGSKTATGVSERRLDVVNTNPQNAATIGDSANWTDADTKEVIALVGDLGSLAAAFVPGANIASAAIGAGASTMRYKADVERGTSGAGLNYLLNLGMDAATALPLAGGFIKTGRVVKAVKKALPLVIKAASVYGLGSAVVDTAKKIANGEDFTVRDVSMIVNALTAGVGIKRQGGLGRKTTKTDVVEPLSLKGRATETPELSLTSEQMKDIKSADDLFDAMFAKAQEADPNITKEQFGEKYDVDSLLKTVKKWKPDWNPKTWFKKKKVKVFKPSTKTETTSVTADEGSFKEWWHGVGAKQRAYNMAITGEPVNKRDYLVETRGGQRSTRRVWDGESWKEVRRTEKPYDTGQFALSSVPSSPGTSDSGNLLPAPIRMQQTLVPVRGISTTITLEPATTTRTVTRKGGVRFDRAGYNSMVDLVRRQSIAIPQIINPFTKANQQTNRDVQPAIPQISYQPVFKKGGKIVKAQSGTSTFGFTLNALNFPKLETPTWKNPYDTGWKNPSLWPASNKKEESSPKQTTVQDTSPASYDFGTVLGGPAGKVPYIDLTMPANWIGAAVANRFANRQKKAWDARYRGNPRDVFLNAQRFQLSGAGDAIRQNGRSQLFVRGNTSNWLENEAVRKAGQAANSDAQLKGNLQDAQEYAQYRANLDEFNNSEAKRHGEFYNTVDNLKMQQSAADAQVESQLAATKSNIFNKAWYANTKYLDQMLRQKAGITAKRDLLPTYQSIQTQYAQNLKAWSDKWKDNTESEGAQADLAAIKANTSSNMAKYDMLYENYALPNPFRVSIAKNGGKVGKDSKVTYSRDPYPELLIQDSKDSTKLVEKLNDSVIKLLLQAKPIHVS